MTTREASNLTPQDFAALEGSYITRELAGQARIFRVDSHDGALCVGRNGGGDYAGLVFPYYWPGESRVREYRLRRDRPELERRPDGTHREKGKYLSPPGRGNLFYIPPGTPSDYLSDATVPAAVTEGEKKALALYRFFAERGEHALVIALSGVWNWRGTIGKVHDERGTRRDEKGPISDFGRVNWQGRTSYIVFDSNAATNDSVRAARRGLASELKRRGAAVRLVDIPKDEGVNGVDDLLAIKGPEFVSRLMSEARDGEGDDGKPLKIVRMADVQPEQVHWLWHPYIALGKLTLLEGDPGLGKSWLTCALAAAVSFGRGLPGAEPFAPGNVLMLSAEDGLGDTLRPRLDAVGADVSRVFALAEPMTFDAAGLIRLEAAIIEHAPVLVIIDPLFGFTGGKVDIHRANECRAVSAPLAAIAERHGCAVVAVRHLGKSRGGGHALNAGIGSIDFTAAARSVLLVGQDPDEPTKRAIVQTKNNLAPHGEAVGYTLEGGQFFWTGVSTLTAGRILALPSNDEERGTRSEAIDFLRAALADGPRAASEVKEEARRAGITEKVLRVARERLGIVYRKEGGHFGGGPQRWLWTLPECAQAAEVAQAREGGHVQSNGASNNTYGSNLAEVAQTSELRQVRHTDGQVQLDDDELEERKAVFEFDGGLSREDAERAAVETMSSEVNTAGAVNTFVALDQ